MIYRLWTVQVNGNVVTLTTPNIHLRDVDATELEFLAYELNKHATEKLEEYGISLNTGAPAPKMN